MDNVDKMIEESISKMDTGAKSKLGPLAGAASQKAIDGLKAAKAHALETGNFIPLLALTQPILSLKNLPKDIVLPTMPTIPGL